MTEERWAPVAGFEGLYEVSDHGRVRSARTGRLRATVQKRHGYIHVQLFKNGERRNFLVHRLVATTFVMNPLGLPIVNHEDGQKTNNRRDNLCWTDPSGNATHAISLGLRPQNLPRLDLMEMSI